MKKFLKFLLVFIIIIGGCAAYFFLANGKMMWHVVKTDKDELLTSLNNAITKVHDYGNFNFSFTEKDNKTNNKRTGEILIKFDGEKRYFSATTTLVEGETTTNYSYYCEANGDVANLYIQSGEEKKYRVLTWRTALGVVFDSELVNLLLTNDYQIPKDTYDELYKSSSIAFSFSPFYYGAQIELDGDGTNMKFDISNRGIVRKIEKSTKTTLADYEQTLIVNKPGKEVTINTLSDEQKSEYSLLG